MPNSGSRHIDSRRQIRTFIFFALADKAKAVAEQLTSPYAPGHQTGDNTLKKIALLATLLLSTSAMASDNSSSFVFHGTLIKAGDKYETFASDGTRNKGSIRSATCQDNGAGLAIVELNNGKVYEIEYAPWDVNCSRVRPTSR